MKTPINSVILCAALAGMTFGFTGCCIKGTQGMVLDETSRFPYKGGKIDPYVVLHQNSQSAGPAGNSGSITIPISSFTSGDNGSTCFPSSQGWNKFYVTFYFLGPNVNPPPNPNNYPNPDNQTSVTVDTTDVSNGTTLNTGIVIMDNLNPNSKVCNTNAFPVNTLNPNLSKATFSPTGSGKKYRATVFYKSGTVGPLTQIKVRWSYP